MSEVTYNERKLEELVLYVAKRCEGDPRFGQTKLFKILFFADFTAYRRTGSAITGAAYSRLDKGPVPLAAYSVAERLVSEGRAKRKNKTVRGGSHQQKQLLAVASADMSQFSTDEIKIVDQVIEFLWKKTAKGVSNLTHELNCWQLARNDEIIPYEMVCLEGQPIYNAEDLAWANKVAKDF